MTKSLNDTDWQAGDIVLFSGRSPFSLIIRGATCSRYSHAAIIADVAAYDLLFAGALHGQLNEQRICDWKRKKLLFESTSLAETPCEILGKRIAGTQARDPDLVTSTYPGRVWRMALRDRWKLHNQESRDLTESLLVGLGRKYDKAGAMLAGTIALKWLGCAWRARDRETMVCVEYLAQALKDAYKCPEPDKTYALHGLHPGKMTPKQLARWGQRELYTKPVRIK